MYNNTWLELNTTITPTNRYWEDMTYDESAQKVILFGGRNPGGIGDALDDTWIFDPSNDQWTEVLPTSHPSYRFHFSIIYVPDTEKTIMFGGFRFPDTCFDETWSFDYSVNDWKLLK